MASGLDEIWGPARPACRGALILNSPRLQLFVHSQLAILAIRNMHAIFSLTDLHGQDGLGPTSLSINI